MTTEHKELQAAQEIVDLASSLGLHPVIDFESLPHNNPLPEPTYHFSRERQPGEPSHKPKGRVHRLFGAREKSDAAIVEAQTKFNERQTARFMAERIQRYEFMVGAGWMAANDIAKVVDITNDLMRKQMKILEAAGYIESRRINNQKDYRRIE